MAALTAPLSTNRQNAQLSTGPRTDGGKERVRLNAFKHGIYAKLLVLPGEDQAHFEASREALTRHYLPQSEPETALVSVLHETGWRLSRVVAIETNLHTLGTLEHLEAAEERFGPLDQPALYAVAQTMAYRDNARTLSQISREESRLQRLLDATQKALDTLLAERQPNAPAPVPANKTAPPTNIGFVPPTIPALMPHFTGPLAEIKRKQWIRRQAALVPPPMPRERTL